MMTKNEPVSIYDSGSDVGRTWIAEPRQPVVKDRSGCNIDLKEGSLMKTPLYALGFIACSLLLCGISPANAWHFENTNTNFHINDVGLTLVTNTGTPVCTGSISGHINKNGIAEIKNTHLNVSMVCNSILTPGLPFRMKAISQTSIEIYGLSVIYQGSTCGPLDMVGNYSGNTVFNYVTCPAGSAIAEVKLEWEGDVGVLPIVP
jgi:hypothetical protein